jgi:hypothetical protein
LTTTIKVTLIAWIWLVTSIDIWCCQFLEPRYELNPLARLILVNYGVWTLVAAKVFGTFLATELMRHLQLRFVVLIALGEAILLYILSC